LGRLPIAENEPVIYVLHALLAVTAFLVVVNGFLRGAKKAQIDAILSVILLGLLGTCFFLFGWKAGLAAIVLVFVYAIILRPIAARAAARMLRRIDGSRGTYIGLPSQPLARISKTLGSSQDVDTVTKQLLSGSNRSRDAEDALLDYCEANESTKQVILEFGATREALLELYSRLLIAGAGQWAGGHFVAASAIAYPDTLRYLLRATGEDRDQWSSVVFKLLVYFERGTPLDSSA
jgi:hypothetical protein